MRVVLLGSGRGSNAEAILRARERAQRELGERFDVKGFHEVLLMNGSMPLEVLDDVVGTWITKQKSAG